MRKKLTGNGLWESSRMMLPEHAERIREANEMAKTETKKRPVLDEWELQELGETLTEAEKRGKELILTVWGRSEPVQGKIVKLDPNTRLVHVRKYTETIKVPFMDILKAESPDW